MIKNIYTITLFLFTFLLLTDIKCATPRKKAIDLTSHSPYNQFHRLNKEEHH